MLGIIGAVNEEAEVIKEMKNLVEEKVGEIQFLKESFMEKRQYLPSPV